MLYNLACLKLGLVTAFGRYFSSANNVKASDRKYQVWERNPLSVALCNQSVFRQKLDYLNNNPVAAGLCAFATEYHYSSASFYEKENKTWAFLTHYNG